MHITAGCCNSDQAVVVGVSAACTTMNIDARFIHRAHSGLQVRSVLQPIRINCASGACCSDIPTTPLGLSCSSEITAPIFIVVVQ